MGEQMFGIGAGELLLLLGLALIVIGPQKLPETARTVGKSIAQFRAYTDELKQTLNLQEQLGLEPARHVPSTAAARIRTFANDRPDQHQQPDAAAAGGPVEPGVPAIVEIDIPASLFGGEQASDPIRRLGRNEIA
jgi:Tat protein translocase TatB subunit